MARLKNEIDSDLIKMKEAADWMQRSGHTVEHETEQFEESRLRLRHDFKDDSDLLIALVMGIDDAEVNRLEVLIRSMP